MFGSKLMDQTNFCLTNKSCLILTQHFDCNEGYFRNLLLQHLALCSISEWLNMKISFLEVTQSMFLFSFLRAFYPVALRKVDTRRRILSPFSLSSFCHSFCIFLFLFFLYLSISVVLSRLFAILPSLSVIRSVYFCSFSLYFCFPLSPFCYSFCTTLFLFLFFLSIIRISLFNFLFLSFTFCFSLYMYANPSCWLNL